MHFPTFVTLSALAGVASAHFQLAYPAPRGPFVMNSEPTFCDGFNSAVSNRTTFPLTGGFITLNSEHPQWTLGILVSTDQDPTSFDDFTDGHNNSQFAFPFTAEAGEGSFCLPVDLSATNTTGGISNGQNITLEFVFNGGDGTLYQCADITVSSALTAPPSNVSCSNATGSSSSSSATATSPGASSSSSSSSSPSAGVATYDKTLLSVLMAGLFGVFGTAMLLV